MTREFLQLAHTFDPIKHDIGGWYVSEKLDGMRAYWDGGISRGILTSQIKYANTAKDYRRTTPPRATGLWSRYAKPIAAPNWFLDMLPENIPLDGELYMGRGRFQELISCVKKFDPIDEQWQQVQYMVFDIPPDYEMFRPGKINNPNCKMVMEDFRDKLDPTRPGPLRFRQIQAALENRNVELDTGYVTLHQQYILPMQTDKAIARIAFDLDNITREGGEGLILRRPDSIWVPKRTHDLLKIKRWLDSEATVTGYTWGKGKLEGLMGALKVRWEDQDFELSGFTDAERTLTSVEAIDYDFGHDPGTVVTNSVVSLYFPRGSKVTFRYRELTRDGIPKEARFWRKQSV